MVTLAWLILVFLFKTHEFALLLTLLSAVVLLPAMIPLAVVTYWAWSSRASVSLAGRTLDPSVPVLIALAWFLVSSLLSSDPGENLVTTFLFYSFSLGLLLAWPVLFAASIQILVASRWAIIRRVEWIALSLLPLSVVIYLVAYVIAEDEVMLQARFDASESALYRDVRQSEPDSHRVGLFQITLVSPVEGCTFMETGGDSLDEGFAYCPDELPTASQGSSPEILMGPMNGDWDNADWWTYDFAGSY